VNRSSWFTALDIHGLLAVIIPLFVYLLTLAPSVTFYDSGEFLTAIASLGTPHPPGYPLFVNYAKPFTWLPFGDIAFRVNFATAVSAALACFGVYLLTVKLLAVTPPLIAVGFSTFLRRSTALCAALAFAVTPRLWLQSNHDKPYPLLAFLAALIFWLCLCWIDAYRQGREEPRYLYLGALLCGLASGAHQTIVLLLPSFAFLVLSTDWRLITRIKEQLLALAFFLVGFSVYLYLPVRALRNPLLNWGDPETLTQFLWSFLRKGYPMVTVDRDLTLLLQQLAAFNLVHELSVLGFFLFLTGLVAFRRQHWQCIGAFFIAVLVFLAYIVGYQNTPEEMIFLTEEFFTPLYLLAVVFAGLGLYSLLLLMADYLPRLRSGDRWARCGSLVLLLILPGSLCAANYRENDQHANYLAYDYAVNTFRSLPRGAVLFTWGDSGAFPLWYLQGVERLREDLKLVHVPHLQFRWYLDSLPELFRDSALLTMAPESKPLRHVLLVAMAEQRAKRPVFIDFSTRYSVDVPEFSLRQRGICYQVLANTGTPFLVPATGIWDTYVLRGIAAGTIPFRDLDSEKALRIYAFSRLEAGRIFLARGMRRQGLDQLRGVALFAPELRGEVHRILAGHGVRQ
jgi:4-amino-4-deoxy-L-arabinose transferase-like glycosyltransferase